MNRRTAFLSWLALVAAVLANFGAAQSMLWDRVHTHPYIKLDFGALVWTLSDLDGDQVRDLLVASYQWPNFTGILSSGTGATVSESIGTPPTHNLPFGSVGDVTGDGVDDYVVRYYQPPGTAVTHLVSGATGTVVEVSPFANTVAAPLGDINGDGFGDFSLGDWSVTGFVEVYHGPGFNFAYAWGGQLWTTFGKVVVRCNDVDGDSFPDFVVGSPGWPLLADMQPVHPGYAYLFSGATGALLRWWTGPHVGSEFGESVACPGDLDGDGIDDVVVGAPGSTMGNVFAYSGATGALIGSHAGTTWTGRRICSLGDVDGDGVGDYAVATNAVFQVDVFSGATTSPMLGVTTNLSPLPPNGHRIGWTLNALSDLNGDDAPELIVGSIPLSAGFTIGHIQCYTLRQTGVAVNGAGCPQPNGVVPRIGATGVPLAGSTFEVNLSKVPPGATAALVLGLSSTQFGSIPLPWQVSQPLMPGCYLLTSIDAIATMVTTAASPGVGRAIQPLALPVGSEGLTFHAQWGVLHPPGSQTLASMTRALTVTVQ
jgi:hypothetical protein